MKRRTFIYTGAGWAIGSLVTISSLGFTSGKEDDKKIYKVLKVRCNACKHCLMACKEEAISLVEGKAFIGPDKCNGCGHCVRSCRRQAIVLAVSDDA